MYNHYQMQSFLNTTLEHLKKHKLHPIPENYKVWYEYTCTSNTELNEEIDALMAQQTAISEEICHKLLKKYFVSNEQKDFDAARLAFSHLLNVVISQISNWSSNHGSFCQALEKCTQKLNSDPSISEIKDIITDLTQEAKSMADASNDINSVLGSLNNEVKQLRKDLEQAGSEAVTDSLTGVSNRRGLDERLRNAIAEAQNQHSDLSLIMIDLDHFKTINDSFGHNTGDKVLKLAASIMKKNLRSSDFLARYGGEEFTVILPNTNLKSAVKVADHLRKAISAKQLSTGRNGQIIGRLTISAGVTQHRPQENAETLLDRGDKYMYKAKHSGRNRVISDSDLSSY
ncbi:GGDEF domain-containing protein [Dasania sp. GY-MA-18]|uniref:diguanylate cyclase n=1 Tax=Dasania phycosphaerae TaxID=2950436 RepID=A0A9J6RMZ5_9GAMM|nr:MULTISPECIES: GGDEF domain-containing protein [Dasania]MCR8923128.1 GGDEF domain-containing protein [Dasania sp. GY-MA-18]MCZ0865560.1 GGDEF domain-containing protein [Dasania phycosphaerae]MCZ0869285.1 GGDEF domain-containing protein [Dasania phycosphaerae]